MRNPEILASQKKKGGLGFDPRTKLAVLFTLVFLILGGSFQTALGYLPALLPFLLLAFSKMGKAAAVYAAVFLGCLCLQAWALPYISGIPGYLLMTAAVLPLYFSPSVATAYYIVTTTTVSEFIRWGRLPPLQVVSKK